MPDFGNTSHAADAAKHIRSQSTDSQGVLGSIWSWVNGVASGIAHFLSGAFRDLARIEGLNWRFLVTVLDHTLFALIRLNIHIFQDWIKWLLHSQLRSVSALRRQEHRDVRYLIRLIYVVGQSVLASAANMVRTERMARKRGIAHAEWALRKLIRHTHQVIEREAVSGYRVGYSDRVSILTRVLDLAADREPLIRGVADDIISGILDFVAIDDPIARWLLGYAIRDVISKLGIDRAVGALANDLLVPLIGQPKPRGLHDVIADIAVRLNAIESWQGTFMADGGAQVEQAGELWRDITSITSDVAILGFAAYAATDPGGWSRDINDTVGTAINGVASAIVDLIRGA